MTIPWLIVKVEVTIPWPGGFVAKAHRDKELCALFDMASTHMSIW